MLGRWGGLRIPSEAFEMTWEDIDWEAGRIVIHSPKTRHQGKPARVIPMFPELEPELIALAESQPNGTIDCFPRLGLKSGNVRAPFLKLIRKAKVEPWAKVWSALRSTRQTELGKLYPIHVACYWLGNTPGVALKHYMQATDEDFDSARTWTAEGSAKLRRGIVSD